MAYFDYKNLDSTEFEALAKDIMQRIIDCRLFSHEQGKDNGIDLYDDIETKRIVVQCKRYQQGSFINLLRDLEKEDKPKIDSMNPRPERYYLFTPMELRPRQKEIILDLMHEYMENDSFIVDGIAINEFFQDKKNHDLIEKNIRLFASFPENYDRYWKGNEKTLPFSWEEFVRMHGGVSNAATMFEKAIIELLQAENQANIVYSNNISPADNENEILVHREKGIDVYQCKFFIGNLNSSRWNQIKVSFSKAMEPKGASVLQWVLCMPIEMQKEDLAKWKIFRKERESYDVKISLIDGNDLIRQMQDCDRYRRTDLIERYFGQSMRESKSIYNLPKCLTAIPVLPKNGLIGRDKIVNRVLPMLSSQRVIALVGVGGVGKTAVMQKVCMNIRDDGTSENYVAWIKCGETLEDDLLTLRDALGIPKWFSRKDAFDAIIRELKNFPGALYLFMDDMGRMLGNKELGILNTLRSKVLIMITSRHDLKDIPCIKMDVLDDNSAVDLFYSYYKKDKERKYINDVMKIIYLVEKNTLLIELLAKLAYQFNNSLDLFLRDLEKEGAFTMKGLMPESAHDEIRTIEESVRRLYNISDLTNEQKRIMSLFSIFTPENKIYGKIVEWAGFDANVVDVLVDYEWLSWVDDGLVIRQIIRDSILRQIGDGLKIEEYGELLERIADTDSYMPRVLDYEIVRERMVLTEDVAKNVERRMEMLLKAEKRSEKEDKLLRNSASLFNNLAYVYDTQGDFIKALEYNEKAIEIREKVLGTDHPDTVMTYNNIGLVYSEQGDYAKAQEYYERALKISKRVLGSNHPNTALTYNNIALAFELKGDYIKALEYNEKALEIRNRVLGADHPDTAVTYNNMALVYVVLGDYARAREYNEKALNNREQILGTNHPDIAETYNNMSLVYYALGDYEGAMESSVKALKIRERVLGSNHPDTAETYNNMGTLYYTLGDYEKALEYYSNALLTRERVLGRNHPDTATTYDNVAKIYYVQGDYERALEYYRRALKIFVRVLGRNHPNTAMTYDNFAKIYYVQGNYERALKYYRRALRIFERVLGRNHPNTAMTINNIAMVYYSQRAYDKALEYYRSALEILERELGGNHPNTAMTINNIAMVYYSQRAYKEALQCYRRALKILKRELGGNHPNTAITINNMAMVYYSQGEYTMAMKNIDRALKIRQRAFGNNHPDTAETYNNLGLIYSDIGEYKKALENYLKALSIREMVLGEEHLETAVTYVNIANVYRSLGDNEKAFEYYSKTLSIRKRVLGIEHPDTIAINNSIASLSFTLNDAQKTYIDRNSIQMTAQSDDASKITYYHRTVLAILALFPRNNCPKLLLQNLLGENKSRYENTINELNQMGWISEESGIIFATQKLISSEQSLIELGQAGKADFYRDLLNRYLSLPVNQLLLYADIVSNILSKLSEEVSNEKLVAFCIGNVSKAVNEFFKKYPMCQAACIYIDSRNQRRLFCYYDLINHETALMYSVDIKSDENVISLLRLYSKNHFALDFSMLDSEKRIFEIPDNFCCNNQFLNKLVLPENVNRIGTKAFCGCSHLNGELVLPESLIEIDSEAFFGCVGLSGDIHLPSGLEVIRERAFAGCKGLSGNLYLSNSLKEVKDDAFNYQYGLKPETTINPNNEEFTDNTVSLWGKIIFPNNITRIENNAYEGFTGLYGELQLHESIVSIGDWAFAGCKNLSGNLIFHNSIEMIGNYAFDGCSGLSGKVVFGNKLFAIGRFAFRKCVNLTGKLEFPETLKELGECAFGECIGLTGDLKLPDSITVLKDDVFNGCKGITGLTFSPNLKRIGDRAFCDCVELISTLEFPKSLTIVGDDAFKNCIRLSGGLHFKENTIFIGDRAFLGCECLKGELHIPRGIFSIGLDAFSGCTGLKKNGMERTIYSSRDYIKELLKKEEPIPLKECKVVFLGAGGAGKSLAISRLLKDGDFDAKFDGNSTPGIQISHHNETIGENSFQIHYWDFGGQEILYSMHRVFMSQRTLYVVFLNARDNLQDETAQNWLHDISIYAPESPVLLVINQIDQNPSASINEKRLHELYPQLRETIKLSALNYSKEEFNNTLIKSIHSLIEEIPGVNIPFPATWKGLLRQVSDYTDKYIDLKGFKQLCLDNSIPEYEDVHKILLNRIQDLGIGFFYKKKTLDEFVMLLEPEWIINAIYTILFNGSEYAENGVISHKTLYKMLRGKKINDKIIKKVDKKRRYKKSEVDYILSVLRANKLSYKKEKDAEFLPMLCERDQIITTQEEFNAEAIHIIFRYTYKPIDVFHRLIVEMHRDLVSDKVWYSGAILKNNQKQIEALINVVGNELHFQVRSKSNNSHENEYSMILHDQISSINMLLGVFAEKLVVYHSGKECAEFYYDDLIGSKKYDIKYIYSHILDKKIEVNEILKFSDSEFTEYHKILLNKILEALQKLQNNRMYYSRKENDRNTYIRDLLEMCNYTCKDQTLGGVSETENEAGELDILIEKIEGPDESQLKIVTIYEALILRNFNDSDRKNVNKHVKKLLRNYNQIGCPILYLVTYAEWKTDEFDSKSQQYFSYVQDGIDSTFNVTNIGQKEQYRGQYMCYRKITYNCGGIPFSVYHILVRIENSPEEELKKSILKLAIDCGKIKRDDIEKSFVIGTTKASRILKILCEEGKLILKIEERQKVYYPFTIA